MKLLPIMTLFWWQGWGFGTVGLILTIGLLVIAIGWLVSAVRRQNHRLEQQVEQRTAELKQANEALQREVAERQQAEQTLREAELKMRLLTQSASEAIVSADRSGNIITWNRGAELIFQYSSEEAIGKSLTILMPERYHQAHTQGFERYMTEQEGALIDNTVMLHGQRKDGREFPLELSLSTWDTHEGHFVGAILRDISQRKQAEEVLANAKEAAESANRAKSEFLANMSHELRTPLNAILGFAQLMNRSGDRPPDDRENLQTIITSGEHLLALINDVLEMSKIEAGRITLQEDSFDLYRLLSDLDDMFHLRAADKGLTLVIDYRATIPQYIYADARKLRQVLINLLANAIKFTDSGRVMCRVLRTAELEKKVTPGGGTSNTLQLLFEISDTGAGILPEEQDNLFRAFVQTSSGWQMQEGTGLGLAVSRQFVQLMGGDIAVQSSGQPGQGTVFSFAIPVGLVETVSQISHTERRLVGLVPGQPRHRILVAEDTEISRRLLVKILEPLGFEVREAANGQEAVAICESWEPHLIWMDMRMPLMDGYEATRRIRAGTRGQAPVIIALTASAFEEQRIEVLSAGCDDFVRKPFKDTELFNKITEYLGLQFEYEESVRHDQGFFAGQNQQTEALVSKLRDLNSDWLAEVHYAAARAQAKTLLTLITQIQADQPGLGTSLTELVNNFEFEKIKMLVEPHITISRR